MAVQSVGTNKTYQLLLTNYQNAMLEPLQIRCAVLSQLLQDAPLKEVHGIFSSLVESIFGFQSGVDWGLLTLDRNVHIRDFDAAKRFLSPDGPLLNLIYKFIGDVSSKFQFPLSCLPTPSLVMLKEGKVPALYANKLQVVSPGLFPTAIQLNAFEFYFFHFGYFIVNSSLRTHLNIVNQDDTLYAHLLEDYLRYFLPTESRAVPLFQSPHNIQHSPISSSSLSLSFGSPHSGPSSLFSHNATSPNYLTPVRQKPSILKKDAVMMITSPNTSCGLGSPQTECWKSETFLLILKEMFLNQNSFELSVYSWGSCKNVLGLKNMFVPSHYHVWMVRIFLKHLHFFFNSTLASNGVSGHGQIMIDSLGRLKSLGMTQLVQKEVYCFLKSTFDHWPLDASFRVPLETWLSYIQPWRYVQADLDLNTWQKFVTENILFYTSMFIQVLRRFVRMDLNCPKNAYMLYRVSKVFSSEVKLREMIMQAEKGFVSSPSSLNMSSSYIHRSPEKSFSFRKISHLNSSVTNYVPLFSEQVFLIVTHLLAAIMSACEQLECNASNPLVPEKMCLSNVSNILMTAVNFFAKSDDPLIFNENSEDVLQADVKKVPVYLNASIQKLCAFFNEVNPPVHSGLAAKPDHEEWGNDIKSRKLTPDQVWQMASKKKRLPVTYDGNPDLQPVRTYEIAKFVEMLNEFSQRLNEKYGSDILRVYYQSTIWGKVCRKILAKPITYYEVTKSKDMLSVIRTPVHLPPRIQLRFLANKQLIFYFLTILSVFFLRGYHPIITILLIFFITSIAIFLSAVLYPVKL